MEVFMKKFMATTILVLIFLIGYSEVKAQELDKQRRVPGPIEMLNNSAQG